MIEILLGIVAAELGLVLVILGILCYEIIKPKSMPEFPFLMPIGQKPQEKPDDEPKKPEQPTGTYI